MNDRIIRESTARTAGVTASLLLAGALVANGLAGSTGVVRAARPAAHLAGATMTVGSTKPANGDVNPYGIAIVPKSMGTLVKGNVLVSNFNNGQNQAGRGTTIVQISPSGRQSLFAQIDPDKLPGSCPGGVGLTTALAVFQRGYVIVGSLPTADGTPRTAQAGCLLVLNSSGKVISTITAPDINGPWDMAAVDDVKHATLFITNVLNGTVAAMPNSSDHGTVVRLVLHLLPQVAPPQVLSNTVIADGFESRMDPNALVIGPTGAGLGKDGTLYVADTLENRIAAIPNALTRTSSAYTGMDLGSGGALNGPLGLAIAPNGDILTTNANDGNLVETTIAGTQVVTSTISTAGTPPGVGALFGLAVAHNGDVFFGDDNALTLNRWTGSQNTTHGIATIVPENGTKVTGVAFLIEDPRKHRVEVMMQITNLPPNSDHPTHIHLGNSCFAGGPVGFELPDLISNAQGIAVTQTTINTAHIPATGWYINIHTAPGSANVVACGVVMPPM